MLYSDDQPLICFYVAGARPACSTFSNGAWKNNSTMNNTRASFAMTKSPFQNNSLLVTGGEIFATQNFDEVLVEGKWEHSPVSLPLPIRRALYGIDQF